jgi:hypothetical protein
VLLWPYIPDAVEKLLAALGAPDTSLEAGRYGAARATRVEALDPLFPKQV